MATQMPEREKIAQYRLEQELGRGAMGVVYCATDTIIGRRIALKVIKNVGDTRDPSYQELRRRFQREGRSAGSLSHPNIVTVYHIGEDAGLLFMAIEYVDGGSLDRLLEPGKPLRNDLLWPVLQATAAALDHAHSRKVVHRDVKPANILVASGGAVKLTDFGIARSLEQQRITRTGLVVGTPFYMSPEQILSTEIDGRSDQFSLGVVAYELLTGQRPFGGESTAAICFQIVHGEAAAPQTVRASLPAAVEPVIAKALAKKPEDRFRSCMDFIAELQRAYHGGPTFPAKAADGLDHGSATNPRRSIVHSRPLKPVRAYVVIAGAMLVILLAAVIIQWQISRSNAALEGAGAPSADSALGGLGHVESPKRPSTAPGPGSAAADADAAGSAKQPSLSPTATIPPITVPGSKNPAQSSASVPAPSPAAVEPPRLLEPQWAMVSGSPGLTGATVLRGPGNPRTAWSIRAAGAVRGSAVVAGDGTVFFGDQGRILHAVRNGEEVWAKPQGGAILGSPALVPEGVVVATAEPNLKLLDLNGEPGWSLPIGLAAGASPIAQQGTVFIGGRDGVAYAISRGKILWRADVGAPIRHTVSADSDSVYVAAGTAVHALDLRHGTVRWTRDLGQEVAGSPAVDARGSVYAATIEGHILALDHAGEVRWKYRAAAAILAAPSIHPNGSVLFGCADRNVYAVRDGELLWKFPTVGAVRSSPIIDRAGISYFGATDGSLYAVTGSGNREWTFPLGGELSAPASLTSDGTLIAATLNRLVLALR